MTIRSSAWWTFSFPVSPRLSFRTDAGSRPPEPDTAQSGNEYRTEHEGIQTEWVGFATHVEKQVQHQRRETVQPDEWRDYPPPAVGIQRDGSLHAEHERPDHDESSERQRAVEKRPCERIGRVASNASRAKTQSSIADSASECQSQWGW